MYKGLSETGTGWTATDPWETWALICWLHGRVSKGTTPCRIYDDGLERTTFYNLTRLHHQRIHR
jgi:hypothetical protein